MGALCPPRGVPAAKSPSSGGVRRHVTRFATEGDVVGPTRRHRRGLDRRAPRLKAAPGRYPRIAMLPTALRGEGPRGSPPPCRLRLARQGAPVRASPAASRGVRSSKLGERLVRASVRHENDVLHVEMLGEVSSPFLPGNVTASCTSCRRATASSASTPPELLLTPRVARPRPAIRRVIPPGMALEKTAPA